MGRIPSCIDGEGIDVFAVESFGALSVSWNVNSSSIDFAGGFRVRWGLAEGVHDSGQAEVGAQLRDLVVAPLDNDVVHYVVVEALSAGGAVTFTSCEVAATPHPLAFGQDHTVEASSGPAQTRPDLACNREGDHLYLAWEEQGAIVLAQSTDFGDTWRALELVGPTGASPSLAVREAVVDPEQGTVVEPESLLLAWEAAGEIVLVRYFPAEDRFAEAYLLDSGTRPDVAIGPDAVHVVYLDATGAVSHSGSNDGGATFLSPSVLSSGTSEAGAPVADVDQLTGDVHAGWHAIQGAGDTNVFAAASLSEGTSFGGAVRIDDDTMGLNQLNLSLAADERSGRVYATWEDRRGGANVFFTWSDDQGASWQPNIDVGAGLGGDQFRPRAVVDVARNVYVVFQDTTSGQRPVFTRFNSEGSFDPPLAPSSVAGTGGVSGDRPAVAADRYGTVY
ncbi:MAG: hypothetical protein K8H88_31725, partial [Sandaracinaceae bacterium]|nr:hypothetical protein [Sandaracinaceae bacterium]